MMEKLTMNDEDNNQKKEADTNVQVDKSNHYNLITSAPTDFIEMVGMGIRLEELVRDGRLTKNDCSSNGAKKYGVSF